MAGFVTNHKAYYDALSPSLPGRSLTGKSALVTGSGRGVGVHIARGLAEAGVSPIGLLGRDKSTIESAEQTLSREFSDTKFVAFAADITDADAIAAVFAGFGAPDILVNNAGIFTDDGPFVEQDLKEWFSAFETNVLGTAIVTQQFLKAEDRPKEPIVLNVISMAAHTRFPVSGWSGYGASKVAQARVLEFIRFEHPDVRFINVHPGLLDTDGFARCGAPVPPGGMTDGKLTGGFFAWLATEEAAFLSGRLVWADWDIEELKGKKDEILEKDLLLLTVDGFNRGF
ncbi:hypothetical protein V495_04949 [Pseudogymnoascus sp. VKM F-4514 (FW-929)]|nr:hypothetical protein V495_04949 [Pseudogymnoascus sp. VKM F-4514 (FW-929)]KFY58149.1 hypothetical protein V497_05012 [Pseudogymnoascus sp. VKM F-4516 (FW-969)]